MAWTQDLYGQAKALLAKKYHPKGPRELARWYHTHLSRFHGKLDDDWDRFRTIYFRELEQMKKKNPRQTKKAARAASRHGVYVGSTLAYVSTKKLDANKAASKLKLSGRTGIKIKAVGPNPISGKVPKVGWRKEYAKAAYAAVKAPGARRKRAAATGKIRSVLGKSNPTKVRAYAIKTSANVAWQYFRTISAARKYAQQMANTLQEQVDIYFTSSKGVPMLSERADHAFPERRRNSAISIVGPSRARRAVGRSVNPPPKVIARDEGMFKGQSDGYEGINLRADDITAKAMRSVGGMAIAKYLTPAQVREAERAWVAGYKVGYRKGKRQRAGSKANPGRKRNAASILMRRTANPTYVIWNNTRNWRVAGYSGTLNQMEKLKKRLESMRTSRPQSYSVISLQEAKARSKAGRSSNPRKTAKAAAPRTRYMVQVGETPAWVGKLKSDANKAWRKLNAAGLKGLKIFKVQVNKVVKDGWRKAFKPGSSRNPSFPGRKGSGQRFQACVRAMSKRLGVDDPKGLCASIGRKKYGSKGMAKLAARGRKKNPGTRYIARPNWSSTKTPISKPTTKTEAIAKAKKWAAKYGVIYVVMNYETKTVTTKVVPSGTVTHG